MFLSSCSVSVYMLEWIPLVCFEPQSAREEPIHILNVAIKTDCDIDDEGLAAMFREFTQSKVSEAVSQGPFLRTVGEQLSCLGHVCISILAQELLKDVFL